MPSRDTISESGAKDWARLAGSAGCYCTVVEGPDFGRVIPIERDEVVFGRGEEADVRVNDDKVSRRHVALKLLPMEGGEPQRAVAQDLGSKNGVFVNGARVQEHEVRSGDKVRVGDTILRFEVKDLLDERFHEKLRERATTDAPTGLANRQSFLTEARKLAALAARYNRTFSLALVDLDRFGALATRIGAAAADPILKAAAATLTRELRALDVSARWSGDRFVVLFPETALSGALAVAERVRHAIQAGDLGGAHAQDLTASIGVSEFPSSGADLERLIQRAEDALGQAKQNGRNRVCVARFGAQTEAWPDADTKGR